MKKLSNMKLINWHRFVNTDFKDFGKVNLLTGENGSGKTTILDAIQYVLLASSNSFNSAAHLNGKRKVTTYVRSKTGKENNAFERKGAVTSHIALEFYEETTDTYFVLGAVIDSQSETQERTVRYLIEGKRLDEISFVKNDVPLSIKEFKAANKIDSSKLYKTAKSAKAAIANRLGRLENRFFELIPKSIAFKPIDDIKDFVFTYVLDEKSVDIDELQDIVLSYTDLETILQNAQIRLSELEEIDELYEQMNKSAEQEEKYAYYVTRGSHDELLQIIKELSDSLESIRTQIDENLELKTKCEQEKLQNSKLIEDLKIEMSNNEVFITLENQRNKLKELQLDYNRSKKLVDALNKNSEKSLSLLKKLRANGYDNEDFKRLENVCTYFMELKDIAETKSLLKRVMETKKIEVEKLRGQLYSKESERAALSSELKEVEDNIELLKRKERKYPKNTTILYDRLKEVFRKNETGSEPHILCEVLEVEDEEWRNAVEGYLNTQRFYIIVDPDDYNLALSVYEKLRKQKKVYGVGIINADKLAAYDYPVTDTLATVISSKNIYAKRYINWILRNVVMCDDISELEKHKAGITKGCMKYQNRVVSAIRPKIFETPWIGEHSYKVQLEREIEKQEKLKSQLVPIELEIKKIKENIKLLGTESDEYLFHHLDELAHFKNLEQDISSCQSRITELERDKTIVEQQQQLKELEQGQQKLEAQLEKINIEYGSKQQEERQKAEALKKKEKEYVVVEEKLSEFTKEHQSLVDLWQTDYEKSLSDKTYDKFLGIYEKMITRSRNHKENYEKQLISSMQNYNFSHNFGAPAAVSSFPEYQRAYQQLKSTEILEYEEKVQRAKEKAEEEFKEQFLSRLQENIKQAQLEFKQLNAALRDIEFNGESYRFTCKPSKDKKAYYDMIMDPETVGVSIFSGSFFDKHKEEIEELFNQLTESEDEDEIEELMDYRNYLDFDIQITHPDNSFSLYSKVAEEKSGGETQTPFYVAIAASFVQLYKNSISDDAAGLIMFDEAFNNMDDERIAGVLSFIRKLPLQVLIAAPTDRTQYIIPYTDQTIAVYSEGQRNYIAEYSNLNLTYDEAPKQATA